MKRTNQKFLQRVFYTYWMARVPELEELEAIDHLEWELRNMNLIPMLVGTRLSATTKRRLRAFLKKKGISTVGLDF